jgi:hypothetical protein
VKAYRGQLYNESNIAYLPKGKSKLNLGISLKSKSSKKFPDKKQLIEDSVTSLGLRSNPKV